MTGTGKKLAGCGADQDDLFFQVPEGRRHSARAPRTRHRTTKKNKNHNAQRADPEEEEEQKGSWGQFLCSWAPRDRCARLGQTAMRR
eukprot:87082-Pyramimonas_sp.AAC.1